MLQVGPHLVYGYNFESSEVNQERKFCCLGRAGSPVFPQVTGVHDYSGSIRYDTTYNDTITQRSFVITLQPGKIKSVSNDFQGILSPDVMINQNKRKITEEDL